jgi:hypothetical protein
MMAIREPQIHVNDVGEISGIDLWHRINGEFVHICQERLDTDEPVYYTNGVREDNNN